jgi:hypothetical protein
MPSGGHPPHQLAASFISGIVDPVTADVIWALSRLSIFINQPEAAFEQLQPELTFRFRPEPQVLVPFHPDWSFLNFRVVPFESYALVHLP